mgnify:CR=1
MLYALLYNANLYFARLKSTLRYYSCIVQIAFNFSPNVTLISLEVTFFSQIFHNPLVLYY